MQWISQMQLMVMSRAKYYKKVRVKNVFLETMPGAKKEDNGKKYSLE